MYTSDTQRHTATRPIARSWDRIVAMLSPAVLIWMVVAVGSLVRFYRYDALSLWLDEGITVNVTRLPWLTVLGLRGAYETHPPLYFVLVKLTTLFIPEVDAGRVLSIVAGILTIPVLYLLTSRLIDKWAAVVAATVLALSPVHIWYSQEARMYTMTVLLVAISYLAIIAFYRSGQMRWVMAYGLSVLCALYVDYSSIYALAPQLLLLIYIAKVRRREAYKLWIAGAAAILAFLPWATQLLSTMQTWGTQRASYLGVTPIKVAISLISLTGAGGNNASINIPNVGYFWGRTLAPWGYGIAVQLVIVICIALVICAGVVVLVRRAPLALFVSALLVGTIVVDITLSLISPGYAERTVLPALLGWAIVVGGAVSGSNMRKLGKWVKAGTLLGAVSLIFISMLTLLSIYTGALKQEWRELAAATASASAGKPVITYPTIAGTLIDAYQPRLFDGREIINIADGGNVPPLSREVATRPPVIWLAYMETAGIEKIRSQLEALGYKRISHQYYPDPLYLDLYAQPGAERGALRSSSILFTSTQLSLRNAKGSADSHGETRRWA